MYTFLKKFFATFKRTKNGQTFSDTKVLHLCPFCLHVVAPTQDCPSCDARSLHSEFWVDGIPMMAKRSVDDMDLLLWKSGSMEKSNDVLAIRTSKDTPAYLYSESARVEHERFRTELDEASRPKIKW